MSEGLRCDAAENYTIKSTKQYFIKAPQLLEWRSFYVRINAMTEKNHV